MNRAYPVTVNSYQDHLLFSIERAVIFAFSRIGVPFFFMITGALLLPRNYENDLTLKKFYKNNYLNLLVTSEIWIIIMYLTIILWNFRGWDIPSTGIGKLLALLKAMLFNSAYTYSSIWDKVPIVGVNSK